MWGSMSILYRSPLLSWLRLTPNLVWLCVLSLLFVTFPLLISLMLSVSLIKCQLLDIGIYFLLYEIPRVKFIYTQKHIFLGVGHCWDFFSKCIMNLWGSLSISVLFGFFFSVPKVTFVGRVFLMTPTWWWIFPFQLFPVTPFSWPLVHVDFSQLQKKYFFGDVIFLHKILVCVY